MILIGFGVSASADSKGFCPPTPSKPKVGATKTVAPQIPPSPESQFVGTVTLMAVISDTGSVCDAQVIRGVDKQTNQKAEKALRAWHFEPARKDGHAVPVVISVDLTYWRRGDEIVQFPTTLAPTQTQ
jgi:TonB family protein